MKKKTSIFQWAVLGTFFLLAMVGFVLFSTYKGTPDKNKLEVGKVIIWGTMDKEIVLQMIQNLRDSNESFSQVTYIEKSKKSYSQDILEALASGESPDLMLLSNDDMYTNLNKILPIPYTSLRQRDFIDQYADAFSLFLSKEGIWAMPLAIDPMVMYYNKDIFRSESIPLPPKQWQEFSGLSKKITKLDEKENITRATISFGESINVTHVKGILSTLMMQLGNNIVAEYEDGYGSFQWNRNFASPVEGLLFFTEFSNQANPIYSWNRSLPNSNEYFLSGRLATYFGFASEAKNIRFKNPNLNFDVAEIPALAQENNILGSRAVYARTWGLAIPKSPSVNVEGAFHVATALSSVDSQKFLSEKLNLPPVRKDLLAQRPESAFMDIFYREAIYARSFIDPNWVETEKIFKFMINSITGGREQPSVAAEIAFDEIDNLFRK